MPYTGSLDGVSPGVGGVNWNVDAWNESDGGPVPVNGNGKLGAVESGVPVLYPSHCVLLPRTHLERGPPSPEKDHEALLPQ